MLKCIYIAPDEFTAITIQELLKSANIQATIRRFETSWLDGLAKVMKGGWGEVLVDEPDTGNAKEFIEEFLRETADG